jgi:two-component system sensor histidine kinase HydH
MAGPSTRCTGDRRRADPAQLLQEAADSLADARIQIEVKGAPESWQLDALRMDQVLKNLLQNAIQAAPEGSPIEASVTELGGSLVFVVRDHGEGLPIGSEQQIFEPFHTTRVKGTGLGLAIARRIVELHGGQIRAENHSDGGAVFTLTIPG